MSYFVCSRHRRRLRVVAEFSESVHRHFAFVADRQRRAGKRFVRNRFFDDRHKRAAIACRRPHPSAAPSSDRQDAKCRIRLSNQCPESSRASARAMGICPKSARATEICATSLMPNAREPRLGLRKILNQVRTSESNRDHRLAGVENLFRERGLLRRTRRHFPCDRSRARTARESQRRRYRRAAISACPLSRNACRRAA